MKVNINIDGSDMRKTTVTDEKGELLPVTRVDVIATKNGTQIRMNMLRDVASVHGESIEMINKPVCSCCGRDIGIPDECQRCRGNPNG